MPFDFATVTAPFRMQPSLRRLAAGSAQLTPNDSGCDTFEAKLAVLNDHWPHALVAADGFDAAPALRALMHQAIAEHPDAFSGDGEASFAAHRIGASIAGRQVKGDAAVVACLDALPSEWRLAGLISLAFAEDFAIIDGANGRIPWLAVCLPSRWAPEEKVGRHFAEVHAPVADNQLLVTAADHIAKLVTGGERWERFVWTVSSEARLGQHPKHTPPTAWPAIWSAAELAARATFRTERQTFIPLPDTRQAVFTIHVESHPLAEALKTPAHARQVHDALATMSPAVLAYRGLADARERLLQWLAQRAKV